MSKSLNPNINNNFFKEVLSILTDISEVNCILLVGSAINTTKPHDIDLLILVENVSSNNNALDIIKRNFKGYKTILCDDSIRIVRSNEKDINIATFETKFFERKIKNILVNNQISPESRVWCLGYWLPEMLLKDTITSEILYEKSNYNFMEIKELISNNYPSIKSVIKDECSKEFYIRLENLKKCENDDITFNILKNSLNLSIIRYVLISTDFYGETIKQLIDVSKDNNIFKESILKIYQAQNYKDIINITDNLINSIEWRSI